MIEKIQTQVGQIQQVYTTYNLKKQQRDIISYQCVMSEENGLHVDEV